MKQFKLFLSIAGIFALGFQTFAQQGGKDPERFYNVESYKADITLIFNYQLSQPGTVSRSVSASQKFKHFFTTAPGARTIGDLFQIQRGDKGKEETHEGDLYGDRINLDKMAKAMENSNVDPKVLEMLKQSKKEGQSFNISLNKYKNWMVMLQGSLVSSSIQSKYREEKSGIVSCGDGGRTSPYIARKNYKGSIGTGLSEPDWNNPNSFVLQLNLDNNSYSFLTSIKMPRDFQVSGESYTSGCRGSEREFIKQKAYTFMSVKGEKEGLIYKHPLPESGLILSGTKIITDSFAIGGIMNEENANWSVRINWSIYPADMEVPDVFISYKNKEEGKKWIPEDGNEIEAIMEWEGNYKPEIIEWELFEVSAEPGTCLNSEDKNEEFDLEFEESMKENGYEVVKTETGYTARKEGNNKVGKESILIKSRDYGSYGLLSGKIRVNGIWCDAYDKELGNNGISIPWDKNENHIADKWEKEVDVFEEDYLPIWDEEENPLVDKDKFPGDGLSLYEEYRGLVTEGDHRPHFRLDPNKKELIVVNEIGAQIKPGLTLFESASKIEVIVLKENELPETRIVNSNYATGHNQDQYGVIFREFPFVLEMPSFTIAGAYPLETLNKSPKETEYILVNLMVFNINASNTIAGNNPDGDEIPEVDECNLGLTSEVISRFINETIAHELAHAVGANHHGDKDAPGETLTTPAYKGTRAYDLSGKLIEDYSVAEPLKICSPVGTKNGQASGSLSCLMRYNSLYLWRYESPKPGLLVYYQVKDEAVLNTFCTSDSGGSNQFGDATTGKGNCLGRLRVKDY